MPTAAKTSANMAKHMTQSEIEARQQAEEAVMPSRRIDAPRRQKPELIRKDPAAVKYWARILQDMDGLEILDILDTDALGIYCAKMARRDDLQRYYLQLRSAYEDEPTRANLKDMIGISAEIQAVETSLLAYATKLGRTAGRGSPGSSPSRRRSSRTTICSHERALEKRAAP